MFLCSAPFLDSSGIRPAQLSAPQRTQATSSRPLRRDSRTNLFRLGEQSLRSALNGGDLRVGWLALPQGHLLGQAVVLRGGQLRHLSLTRPPGGPLDLRDHPLTRLLDPPQFCVGQGQPEPSPYVWNGRAFELQGHHSQR